MAVVGVPFDTATSHRPGARFGPEAIRSRLDRRCAPTTRRSTWTCSRALSVVDRGDLDVTPGNAERTAGQIAAGARAARAGRRRAARARRRPLDRARRAARARGGARPAGAGAARRARRHVGPATTASATSTARRSGARSRRACCARSARCWRACAARCTRARDLAEARETGLRDGGGRRAARDGRRPSTARRVRERVGDAPAFFSFDIDVIDPAFAPGTGTPEVAGLDAARGAGADPRAGRHAVHRLRRGRGLAALRRRRARRPRCWRRRSPTSSWR